MQKKASILALYEILKNESDEHHPLQRKDIERILETRYDIKIDRKTLHDHIELLNLFDYDIFTPTSGNEGYYLGQRLFELSEVHLLSNAVYAAHFIPEKYSNDLIKKLLSTQGKYAVEHFDHSVQMRNLRKTSNKQFFTNIEILMDAIQSKHPISFQYVKYDLHKNLIPRKDHRYIIHPYYIIYANENYYLICKNDNYDNLSHYRIDKMLDIEILHDREIKSLGKSFDPYEYAKSKIYMFGGDEELITLKCTYNILDDIIDRFGNDVKLQKIDNEHFLAIIKSSRQGMLYLCLQYLQYCEITSPASLRDEMKVIIQNALDLYK